MNSYGLAAACRYRLLPALWLLWLPLLAQAQFNYTVLDGTVVILKYTGSGGTVVIPSTINGLPVTRIGNDAFLGCNSLTGVTIPAGVTSIDDGAFNLCANLTNVTLPTGLLTIGRYAFAVCSKLPGIALPNTVTNVDAWAFSSCTSLTNLTLSTGLTNLAQGVLNGCGALRSVRIPNSILSIGDSAFYKCRSLTNLTLSTNVVTIGSQAFKYCSPASIALSKTLTNIGSAAFGADTNLTSFSVDALNPAYTSVAGVLLDKNQKTLLQCPARKTGSYAIPNGVETIAVGAFSYCAGLTNVTFPAGVTNIADEAFLYCNSLTNAVLPNGLTNIGAGAFYQCKSLASVSLPQSLGAIGHLAFYYCSSLKTVAIPASVTRIGTNVFSLCSSLTAITVDALNPAYSSVEGVLLNKSQTILIRCPGAKTGYFAVPGSVTRIESAAFEQCWNLNSVILPNGLSSIGSYAFASCTGLSKLVLPASLSTIDDYAFAFCTGLTDVYFQGNTPSFWGYYIFSNSTRATVYYLPGTSGWDTAYPGRPKVLWNPQPQTADSGFGLQTNRFGFTITGTPGISVVVEACTNLAAPVWSPAATNTLTNGTCWFSDPQGLSPVGRFYRLRSP